MHKRKQIGIIKYGPKLKTSVLKFQAGGAAALVEDYDWRKDPYEMMLMQQEAQGLGDYGTGAKKKGRTSSGGSGSSAYTKAGQFPALTGGLQGSNRVLNAEYSKMQNAFFSEMQRNDPSWIKTPVAQQQFQNIVNQGKLWQDALNREEEKYKEAKKGMGNLDPNAYAISTNENIMVSDKEGNVGSVPMKDYLAKVDSLVPMTIKDFMTWKENETGMNIQLIDEFLVQNAMSPKDVYANYVKPREKELKYRLDSATGVIEAKDQPGSVVANAEQWRETVMGLFTGTKVMGVNDNTDQTIMNVAKEMYTDIYNNTEDRSRLVSSLQSEVLKSNIHKSKLAELDTEKERDDYLQQQVNLALAAKLFDQGKTSTSDDGGGGGPTKSTAPIDILTGANMMLFNGTRSERYVYGADLKSDKDIQFDRVSDIEVPQVRNVISAGKLEITEDPTANTVQKRKNNITTNTEISERVNVNDASFPNGLKVKDAIGDQSVGQYLKDNTALVPGEGADMVYMLVNEKGDVVMDISTKIGQHKLDMRRQFINSWNDYADKYDDDKYERIPFNERDLLPGSKDPDKRQAYTEYKNWIKYGSEVQKHKDAYNNNQGDREAEKRSTLAKSSAKARQATQKILSSYGPLQLKAMLGVQVYIDNDAAGADVKNATDAHSKKTGYAPNSVKPVKGEKARKYMAEVNGIDNSNVFADWGNDGWVFNDNVYKTTLFVPINDAIITTIKTQGLKAKDVDTIFNNQESMLNIINAASALTNIGNSENLTNFLLE